MLNKYIGDIKNKELRNMFNSFAKSNKISGKFIELFSQYVKNAKVQDITLDYIFDFCHKTNNIYFGYCIRFILEIIDNCCYLDENEIKKIKGNIKNLLNFNFVITKSNSNYDSLLYRKFDFRNSKANAYTFVSSSDSINETKKIWYLLLYDATKNCNMLFTEFARFIHGKDIQISPYLIFEITKNRRIESIDDFYDNTFEHDLALAKKIIKKDKKHKSRYADKYIYTVIQLHSFFQEKQISDYGSSLYEKYTIEVLKYLYLPKLLKENWDVVEHNALIEVPEGNRLVIIPNKKTIDNENPIAVDFRKIKSPEYRKLIKKFAWLYFGDDYKSKLKDINVVIDFINRISNQNCDLLISKEDLINYKRYLLSKGIKYSTISKKLTIIRKFITFLRDSKFNVPSESFLKIFSLPDSHEETYFNFYTKDEIIQILKYLNDEYKKTNDPDIKLITYIEIGIIYFISFTEIRLASVLRLKTNSLTKVLESEKDEYTINIESKVTYPNLDNYNVTMATAEMFNNIKKETKNLRDVAPKNVKDKLLICKLGQNKQTKVITKRKIELDLKKICDILNIQYRPLKYFRKFEQKETTDFVSSHNLPEQFIPILAKHSLDVHNKNYVSVDIRKLCVALYDVDVGSVDLSSRIKSKNTDEIVLNGCGSCESSKCDSVSNFSCLQCKHFITTRDNINSFIKEIDEIQAKIYIEKNEHERQFLNRIKSNYVEFLASLLEQGRENNE